MTVRVVPLKGGELRAALPDLARLRITVFREWPYIYEGTLDYEQTYMSKFAASDGALIVAALDGDGIVGAATASPMVGHADEFAEPFRSRGYDVSRIFYFGESVLLGDYRGQGIGVAFFDEREKHARSFSTYTHATFCAVVRPDDHPLKPKNYRPLDAFWRKRGFEKMDGMIGNFSWLDIGEQEETPKPMQFWIKAL